MSKNKTIHLLDCYKKIRAVWTINPKTRIKESKKKYNRAKEKQKFRKDCYEE